jgi:hypothetical protein
MHMGCRVEAHEVQIVQEESTVFELEKELIRKQEQLHEEEQKLNELEEIIHNRFETMKQSEKGLEITHTMLERHQLVLEQSEAELIARTVAVTDREEVFFLIFIPPSLSGFLSVLFQGIDISQWLAGFRPHVLKEKDVAITIQEQELLVVEEGLAGSQQVHPSHLSLHIRKF